MTDVSPAELARLLAKHRKFGGSDAWEKPRCFNCQEPWPCMLNRLIAEVQHRRDAEAPQEEGYCRLSHC